MGTQQSKKSTRNTEKELVCRNEMVVPGSSFISAKVVKQAIQSVCRIELSDGSKGSGFLCTIQLNDEIMQGLFTNNHVIEADALRSKQAIKCVFGDQDVMLIDISNYAFTCSMLDVTFIQMSDKQQENVSNLGLSFLNCTVTSSSMANGDTIMVTQHPGGGELSLTSGTIKELWGVDFYHSASTEYGSSGSPVCNRNGAVIGIHKARSPARNSNIAVGMRYVREAIIRDRQMRRLTYPSVLKQLSPEELLQLRQLGLVHISNHLLVSPSSLFVTPIWFQRTCSFWYWTPTDPQNEANWMRISPCDNLQVIGGYWHGQIPANRNVRIIKYLAENGYVFL